MNNRNFILNSLLKSYKSGSIQLKLMSNEYYYKLYEPIVKKIIENCNCLIINEKGEIEVEDFKQFRVIFSYILFKDDFLYYIYTKNNLRKKKYASKLIEAVNFDKNINIRLFTESGYYFLKKIQKNIYYYPIVL